MHAPRTENMAPGNQRESKNTQDKINKYYNRKRNYWARDTHAIRKAYDCYQILAVYKRDCS